MTFKEALLAEFDHEIGSTRRLLERVPGAQLRWKPHEKSYDLGDLSAHIANLPTWMNRILDATELDLASVTDARPTSPGSLAEVLERLDGNAARARATLTEQTDAALTAPAAAMSNSVDSSIRFIQVGRLAMCAARSPRL